MPPSYLPNLPGSVINKTYFNTTFVKKVLAGSALYDVDLETYWGLDPALNWTNSNADLEIGTDELEILFRLAGDNSVGMADRYDLYSDDIRLVDYTDGAGGSVKFPVANFARAINWTWGEIEKYRRLSNVQEAPESSLNPVNQKLRLLGTTFNKRDHYTILYGYPQDRLYGIFSQKGIARQEAGFRPYATTNKMTVNQIVDDLINFGYYFMQRANLRSLSQVDLKIPPKLGRRLLEPYLIYDPITNQPTGTSGNGFTALRSFPDRNGNTVGIGTIDEHAELVGSELTKHVRNEAENGMYDPNFDRICVRAKNAGLERHFYARKLFDPFQVSTLRFEQICISASSGVICRDLNKIMYIDFPNTEA